MSLMNTWKIVQKALKIIGITEGVLEMVPEQQNDNGPEEGKQHTFVEEIEVEGRHLVERVKSLLHEGNIRKVSIKDSSGKYLLEIPLTVGVVAGGVFVLAAPVAAALGALAALVSDVKVEVVRVVDEDEDADENDA
jgi:hypothetical protein